MIQNLLYSNSLFSNLRVQQCEIESLNPMNLTQLNKTQGMDDSVQGVIWLFGSVRVSKTKFSPLKGKKNRRKLRKMSLMCPKSPLYVQNKQNQNSPTIWWSLKAQIKVDLVRGQLARHLCMYNRVVGPTIPLQEIILDTKQEYSQESRSHVWNRTQNKKNPALQNTRQCNNQYLIQIYIYTHLNYHINFYKSNPFINQIALISWHNYAFFPFLHVVALAHVLFNSARALHAAWSTQLFTK